ncbi:Cytochrome P450 monooygenase 1 [Pseudocercospora fuligena]|uniref:Cytochrome P450 monooygenase 1 n=1 Tax=Pseudocercospora fuligena TaxID=685502 RepID=A0A8H6VH71_9PEZI|nr:Cytochrome P450 monooygenase 1 [Pseudocercospora fuligena]
MARDRCLRSHTRRDCSSRHPRYVGRHSRTQRRVGELGKDVHGCSCDCVDSAAHCSSLAASPVQLFSPHCRESRRLVGQAQRIIMPIVNERRALKAKGAANGIPPPYFDDVIEWAENESSQPDYDIHGVQLAILIGAVHISADTCTQVMIMLAQRPDTVHQLRDEIRRCLLDHGIAKSTFHSMKLLDSGIKETMRFKPASMFSMERGALCDVEVGPGLVVHQNERIVVDMSNQRDSKLYPNPDVFQPDRFFKLREHPDWGSKALLSSTSPEHLAFGHGLQACPGRFFAEIKIKILLCHLLLTYDWKLAPRTKTEPSMFGPMLIAHEKTKILYRKRKDAFDMSIF